MIHLQKQKITSTDIGKKVLFPVYNSDVAKIAKANKPILVDIKSARNPRQHALVFGLARFLKEHLPNEHPLKHSSLYMIIKSMMAYIGMFDEYVDLDTGEIKRTIKSINFEKMSDEEFQPVSDLMFKAAADTAEISEDDLRREYKKYL